MIRGYFEPDRPRKRPFVEARLDIPDLSISANLAFMVDTGADVTTLGTVDTLFLNIDRNRLPPSGRMVGVGGRIATAHINASLAFEDLRLPILLRILTPWSRRQQQAVLGLPSVLGRDVLRHFALFMEERTGRVLLLEPHEADALAVP
jgi:hypothetical protein